MIQSGTYLKVVDNTGAKIVACLKVQGGYRKRYASVGDIILVSIKTLRSKRRESVKVKKGEMYKALILRVKANSPFFCGDSTVNPSMPSVVLLNKNNKLVGTRIFGSISRDFKCSKYLKIFSLSSGMSSF
jgi:large subunit ribosomal protein L14